VRRRDYSVGLTLEPPEWEGVAEAVLQSAQAAAAAERAEAAVAFRAATNLEADRHRLFELQCVTPATFATRGVDERCCLMSPDGRCGHSSSNRLPLRSCATRCAAVRVAHAVLLASVSSRLRVARLPAGAAVVSIGVAAVRSPTHTRARTHTHAACAM
jgi:hypothetical protein